MNPTVTRLAAQALLGQRRVWALAAFPVILIGLAAVMRATGVGESGYMLISGIGFPILLPLVALLAASSVLGPEIEDGSVVYLLAKPVSRHVVAVSKFVVAWVATMIAGVLPLIVAGLVLAPDLQNLSLAWTIGAALAGTAYCAAFIALSAFTSFAVIGGLVFVLVWEGMLGSTLQGIGWVSIRQWGVALARHFDKGITDPQIPLLYALAAAVVVLVAGVWFAGDRLRSFTLARGEGG